ncbi:hypothetical protein F441_11591 [Phytophthora nicotianae CJ01A1]|uniref:Uncharacterized protein n=1 Tax=Phytophthora nicotianae CJ01A1 TaxID=1317063 RepID=W2WS30_PHYNI|nr:hypothetical protein F441_11591 [Phytophthora nicotianae CJ01A1]
MTTWRICYRQEQIIVSWRISCRSCGCIESISKKLQGDELTLLDARALFDGLFELRPSMTTYLSPDAEIVHSPVFEAAVVKVLAGDAGLLTNE